MILSPEELEALTGYKRPSDQCRWFRLRGWRHEVNALGKPVVSRMYAESRLSGKTANKTWEPDFSTL